MKAFILAAGLGTRLRPLTDTLPKAMAPVAPGVPLLEHHIQHLKAFGIRDIVINVHHLADRITSHFGDGQRFGVSISYSDERAQLLDTAGAIRKAAPLLGDEFLLVYGDQLHFEDIGALIQAHRGHAADVTLLVKRSDLPANGDVVELAAEGGGRIVRWIPRPHQITALTGTHYLNAGLYVMSSAVLAHIPEGRPVSLDREVLPAMLAQGAHLEAVPAAGDILDIGTPEKLAYAQSWYAAHPARRHRALFLDRDGVIIHALPRGEYLTDWRQSRLMDGIRSLVATARSAGYLTVVVTNQPQVSRGLLSEDALREIHQRMLGALEEPVDALYYCPHTDRDGCDCRKPRDGMLIRGSRDLQIALDRSIFVGDSDRDVHAGVAAGCRTVLLRNQYNESEAARCAPAFVVEHLNEVQSLL